MKKIFAVLMVFVLTLSLCSCNMDEFDKESYVNYDGCLYALHTKHWDFFESNWYPLSDAFANKLNSLKPKNYSQFAHSQYLKNANMTPNQIKSNMKCLSKRIMISIRVFDFFVRVTSTAISRKF